MENVIYSINGPVVTVKDTKDFSLPDAGSFIACIRAATNGKTPSFIAGKPEPYMIQMFMEEQGCKGSEIAVVGDRLYTDIQSAVNAGVTSVCVLTGETQREDIARSQIRPDYVLNSIQDLYYEIR